MHQAPAPVVILVGERGLGKTSLCRAIAASLEGLGIGVGGILSPSGRDAAGMPREVWAEDLARGERRMLASRNSDLGGPSWPGPTAGVPDRPPISFSDECFSWAIAVLHREFEEARGLVIVDEIGPLELLRGGGFLPFLEHAAGNPAGASLLLTVRPSLAEELARRFAGGDEAGGHGPARGLFTRTLSVSNRDSLAKEIAGLLARLTLP